MVARARLAATGQHPLRPGPDGSTHLGHRSETAVASARPAKSYSPAPGHRSRSNPLKLIFWYQGQAWYRHEIGSDVVYVSPTRIYVPEDGRFVERDLIPRVGGKVYGAYKAAPPQWVDVRGLAATIVFEGGKYKIKSQKGVVTGVLNLATMEVKQSGGNTLTGLALCQWATINGPIKAGTADTAMGRRVNAGAARRLKEYCRDQNTAILEIKSLRDVIEGRYDADAFHEDEDEGPGNFGPPPPDGFSTLGPTDVGGGAGFLVGGVARGGAVATAEGIGAGAGGGGGAGGSILGVATRAGKGFFIRNSKFIKGGGMFVFVAGIGYIILLADDVITPCGEGTNAPSNFYDPPKPIDWFPPIGWTIVYSIVEEEAIAAGSAAACMALCAANYVACTDSPSACDVAWSVCLDVCEDVYGGGPGGVTGWRPVR